MKFIVAVAFVAFFAVASSKNVGIGNKNLITDIIKAIIDNNRDKLANLNVPEIDLKEHGKVTDLNIVGAENFVLEKLDAAGPLSVDISNATISLATASASALIDFINVEVPELGLLINGQGSLSGSASTLFLTVSLDLSLDGLKPHLDDFSNLYISIGELSAELVGVDDVENVNQIINSGLKGFLNANLVPIAEANKAVIIEKINEVLGGLAY